MIDETRKGAKKKSKKLDEEKKRAKRSILGRIFQVFESAWRLLKRKTDLLVRPANSKNSRGFKRFVSGYVQIVTVALIPVLLFGAKYLLDQRSLSDRNSTLGTGRLIKQCADIAAKAVAEKWNPALTYAQQKTAMLRIADEVYNNAETIMDSPLVQAVYGITVRKKLATKGNSIYDPLKITEAKESLQTSFRAADKQIAQNTDNSTKMMRYHFYASCKDYAAPAVVKLFSIMYDLLGKGNVYLFPPDEDLYENYAYCCKSSSNPLGSNTDWYHYVTWPEVVGMSDSESKGSEDSKTKKSYTTRKNPSDDTVTIEIEDDKIKVTTDDDVAYAVPAECNVDIILTVPTNSAALNKDNCDKNTSTSGTPYVSESTIPTVDAKSTPIYQITRAYQEFLKNFFYTRGVNVGVIPYSGKVSLKSDQSDWVKDPDKFVPDGKTTIMGATLYGTKGENGSALTDIGSFAGKGDNEVVGYGLLCRGSTESYGSNKITTGDLLLSTTDPTTSDIYKFRKMVYNPCRSTDANLLSMKCERNSNKYWMNPYFILEMDPNVKFIYNMLGAFYPYYDNRNVSNFIFIPVTWANNLLQEWSATGANSAVNTTSSNSGRLSTPSKRASGRKKVLILVVNKPDWFEPGELTYLGFDNDYSETLAVESDLIRFDKGKTKGAKGILEYVKNENGEHLCFPRKGLLRVVVEPTANSGTIQFDGGVTKSYPSATNTKASVTKRTEFFITPDGMSQDTLVHFTKENVKLISAEITNRPYKIENGKVVYTQLTAPERSVYIDLLKQKDGKFDYQISGVDNNITPNDHLVFGKDQEGNPSDGIKYGDLTYTPQPVKIPYVAPTPLEPVYWNTASAKLPSVGDTTKYGLNSICCGGENNEKFVAVGDNGYAVCSLDEGKSWNRVQMPEQANWRSVCYNYWYKHFLAIAYNSNAVAVSKDGQTWEDFVIHSFGSPPYESQPNWNFPTKKWVSIGCASIYTTGKICAVAIAEKDDGTVDKDVAVFYINEERNWDGFPTYAEFQLPEVDPGDNSSKITCNIGKSNYGYGSILYTRSIYSPYWNFDNYGNPTDVTRGTGVHGVALPNGIDFLILCQDAAFDTMGNVYVGNDLKKKSLPVPPNTKLISADYWSSTYVAVGNTLEGNSISVCSNDNGENWKAIPIDSDNTQPQMTSVCSGENVFFAVAKNINGIYTYTPGEEKWKKMLLSSPQKNPKLKSVCCAEVGGEQLFVAVLSGSNKVVCSSDGINWESYGYDLPDGEWNSICYWDQDLVAVGDGCSANSFVYYGRSNWESASYIPNENWKSVFYDGKEWVAAGDRKVIYSEDLGKKWTASEEGIDGLLGCYGDENSLSVGYYLNPQVGGKTFFITHGDGEKEEENFNGIQSVCYGNGYYVAVGSGKILYSDVKEDEWHAVDKPPTGNWISVCYNESLGRFIAIDDKNHVAYCDVGTVNYVAVGDKKVAYSIDGQTWTVVSSEDISKGNWSSVYYGNGKFVAVGNKKAAYSTNGQTWTVVDANSVSWASVCYGKGKFVAVGDKKVIYSEDGGKTWKSGEGKDNGEDISKGNWKSVCYGKGKFVAVASGSDWSIYSTDGVKWSAPTTKTDTGTLTGTLPKDDYDWNSVCYGSGKFVAIAHSKYKSGKIEPVRKAAYSTDGKTWIETALTGETYKNKYKWAAVCYGDGKFFAVTNGSEKGGNVGDDFSVSSDGMSWSEGNDKLEAAAYKSVCYGDEKFVIAGENKIVYGKDESWTSLGLEGSWTSVCAVHEEEPEEPEAAKRGWYFCKNSGNNSTDHHFIFPKNRGDMYFVTNSEEFTYDSDGDIHPMADARGFFVDEGTYFHVNDDEKYLGSGLYRWTMPAEKAKEITLSTGKGYEFAWSVKDLGDVSLPTLYAGATLPINAALFTGGWQSTSTEDKKSWNGTDVTTAVKKVTVAACKKLKEDWGDNLRVYLIKYRKQGVAGDYSYLESDEEKTNVCASGENYIYDISTEDELIKKLKAIAADIKEWAKRTGAAEL